MELLFVIIIVAVIWWAIKKNKKAKGFENRSKTTIQSQTEVPEIKVTFTSSLGNGRREDAKNANVGALVSDGADGWLLAPNAPIPITIIGGDKQLAQQLKDILASSDYWMQKIPEVALLIAQHNIHFKEVDEFLDTYRKRFDAEISRQISESSEWTRLRTH